MPDGTTSSCATQDSTAFSLLVTTLVTKSERYKIVGTDSSTQADATQRLVVPHGTDSTYFAYTYKYITDKTDSQ